MFSLPLPGRKTYDVLRTVQLLQGAGLKVSSLSGRGCGALIALYSATFVDGLEHLHLSNCIPSMQAIIDADACRWPQSVIVPDLLRWFDLPQIVEYLRSEKGINVEITDPWEAVF